jgi:hypothetical protein
MINMGYISMEISNEKKHGNIMGISWEYDLNDGEIK